MSDTGDWESRSRRTDKEDGARRRSYLEMISESMIPGWEKYQHLAERDTRPWKYICGNDRERIPVTKANLVEPFGYNALQMPPRAEEFYFFVETIETLYSGDGEDRRPSAYWVELDGIFVEKLVDTYFEIGLPFINPQRLSSMRNAEGIVAAKKAFLDALLDEDFWRMTLYAHVPASFIEKNPLPSLGAWIKMEVMLPDSDPQEFSADSWTPPEGFEDSPFFLQADDPYVGVGTVALVNVLDITGEEVALLREIFSLNHIPDASPPPPDAPPSNGPLPVPSSPPPFHHFRFLETLTSNWKFGKSSERSERSHGVEALREVALELVGDGDGKAEIQWDTNDAYWTLWITGKDGSRQFFGRSHAGRWYHRFFKPIACELFIVENPPGFALVPSQYCHLATGFTPEQGRRDMPWPPKYPAYNLVKA